jgi:hypothetical protein
VASLVLYSSWGVAWNPDSRPANATPSSRTHVLFICQNPPLYDTADSQEL